MNDKKNFIKPVDNNQEKGLSYKENFSRYKKAKNSGFYLECLWILYAMLEDRTSAFLYYLGFTKSGNRNSVTGRKKIKEQIRSIYGMDDKKRYYGFNNFSGKIDRIISVIEWSDNEDVLVDEFQCSVKKALKQLRNIENLKCELKYLKDEWRNKRNQLVHSLFTKNFASVSEEFCPLVEGGYKAARVLDAAVTQLKKEGIRSCYKID